MPRTRLVLLLACLVVSACQVKPATQAPAGVHVAATPAARASKAPVQPAPQLAHDGGIVYMAPLDAITDPAKKTRAATLGTELAVSLRAERTMRDADLLAGGAVSAPGAAAYALLGDDEEETLYEDGESDSPSPSPSPSPSSTSSPSASSADPDDGDDDDEKGSPSPSGSPSASGGGDDDKDDDHDDEGDDHDEEKSEEAAKEAWKQLSSEERDLIKKTLEGREAKVLAKLASKLERKKKSYAKQGTDAVVAGADGSKDVTSTFVVANAEGSRTVTVTRKFDAAGTLVQSVQTLKGTAGGVTFSAERSRTVNPDGSIAIVSDASITLDGQLRTIHWEKAIAPDGTLTATGTLTRPDGTKVALSSSGTEDGIETIAGQDGDVAIKLAADVASGSATASVEAGEAGAIQLKLDADDEDDDEGDVDDDDDKGGDDHDDDKDDHADAGASGAHGDDDEDNHADDSADDSASGAASKDDASHEEDD